VQLYTRYIVENKALLYTILIVIVTVAGLFLYNKKANRRRRFKFNTGGSADHKETVYSKGRKTSAQTLHEAGTILIIVVALVLILDVNGLDVTTPLAGLGIAGTIIGLAMQDFLKDTIMGLRIVSDEFFSTGDCVRINGITGIVVNFSLQSTKIENIEDHSVYTICNGQISSIEKLTDLLDIVIPFGYEVSHEIAKKCVERICGKVWMIEGIENCYYKGVEQFGDSAVIYKLRCFIKAEKHPDTRRMVQGIVREVFAEEGLEIPFTQVDIHMKG